MTNPIKYWGDKPYNSLDYYLKKTYGEKVYRLSLNGGMTCPNRDGTLDTRGCIFCSAGGSGDFAASSNLSITEQIEEAKMKITAKTKAKKFIAYFQAYTNTYASVEYLRNLYMEAVMHPDIILLSIATRPDCLNEEILNLLSEIHTIKPVWIELGLQTIHPKTSAWIRSGFVLSDFTDAVHHLYARNIPVITHLILGLPGETRDMMLDSVAFASSLPISGIKLQLLHILKGTDLDILYQKEPFPLPTLEEYANLIADCIEILPENIVIHRITGDGPKKLLTAPLWSADKKRVLNTLTKTLKQRRSYQGKGGIIWQSQIPFTK
ncbi:MAG: TIGR01212 family radical SAM protein [Lachnospiraceae bacterium]|nr:TIGR01212 family radical SAM protein [Lachnospiraceae bacterium]